MAAKKQPDLYYKVNPLDNLTFTKSRKYFTRETALTLYERTTWLDMCERWRETVWGKEKVSVTLRGTPFKIGMLPPRIVLFEAMAGTGSHGFNNLSSQNPDVLKTGFLLTDVYFPQQENTPELDDLLMLNEYFRYFGMPFDFHATLFKKYFGEIPAEYSINGSFSTVADLEPLERYFERWANLLALPIKSDGKYYRLYPRQWEKNAAKFSYNEEIIDTTENWQIYADNRCYVWTAAITEDGGKTLKRSFEPDKETVHPWDFGHWIKLLNIDNPAFNAQTANYLPPEINHRASEFERKWAEDRTYKRWQHDGSWYGFCYHGGASITRPDVNMFFTPYSTYYFDTSLLLFYIRITLFRFSKELTETVHRENEGVKWREPFQMLREQFSKFTILYQYPLLSNQQQNIEMYELNRKHFDIDNFLGEVQKEIDNTHDFLELVRARELSKVANKLTTWGIPMAVAGLLIGIFGVNDLDLTNLSEISLDAIFKILLVILISLFVGLRLSGTKGE